MFKLRFLFVFLFIVFAITSQAKNPPVAKYTFNKGTAQNEAGSVQPKASGTSFVEDRFGNDESAIYLHGNADSYLNLGTDKILKPIRGTISLWLNIDLVMLKGLEGWNYNPILKARSRPNEDFDEGYFIGYNFDTKRLNVTTSEGQTKQITLNSRHNFSLRKWHHIVMTYDDDTLALYLDNQLEAKLEKKFKSIFLEGDSVLIGNTSNTKNVRYLCGTVDDIMIYDRVLSAKEIDALYNAPNPNRMDIYLQWFYRCLAFLALVGLLVWLIIRRFKAGLQLQQEKVRINSRMNELETKAIRTQMNPHFIFNSLNTLQRFILEEDIENANSYLIKFSKLLRRLLESSASESISLKEEIEILNSYIEIEKLRFDKSFTFKIESSIANPEKIQIPFMLIQPFVENAIWHGLLPRQDHRELKITFSDVDENKLLCVVEDNGVGRKFSAKLKDPFKKKSMAIEFIKQRLDILEKVTGIKSSFIITDKENTAGEGLGTIVEITIPKIK